MKLIKDDTAKLVRLAKDIRNLIHPGRAGTAPSGWEEVWRALLEARNAFEQGGETGWSHCVVQVGHALNQWNKIEP